jgi:DNA-directed RNA polymerase alpha subunit
MIVTVDIDDGGPAFPNADNSGMSLRDYFAAKAMQVILANQYEDGIYVGDSDNDSKYVCARSAYIMADAMLGERNDTNKLLSFSVEDLNLDRRALNCLQAEGIHTIGDLCNKRVYDLRCVPNLGRVSLNKIITALAEHGLKLKT